MQKHMNGTLFDEGFAQYTEEQNFTKEAAKPVRNYTHPNPSKYHNPPDQFDQTEDTTRYGETAALNLSNEQERKAQKQKMQALRERAGVLTSEPPRKLKNQRKKWGKFLVIYDGSFSITLGPDCTHLPLYLDWCFLPTYICFLVASIAILSLVFSNSQSIVVKLCGVFICGGQLISYLLMATSNPGIAKDQNDQIRLQDYQNPEKIEPTKMCNKCGFSVPRSSYHCRDCDLCILEYDHHCPWTSKCIGKNNLCRFYTFLAFTPIFLVYIAVAFVVTMSQTASINRVQHISNLVKQ